MNGHNVEIIQDGKIGTTIRIDGKEMLGVTDVTYSNSSTGVPRICLEFVPRTLNFNDKGTMEVTSLDDNFRKYIGCE